MNWKALLCSLFIKWVVNITVCKSMLVAAPFMRTQAFAKVIASIVGSPWSSTNILKKVSAFLMSFREKLGKGAQKKSLKHFSHCGRPNDFDTSSWCLNMVTETNGFPTNHLQMYWCNFTMRTRKFTTVWLTKNHWFPHSTILHISKYNLYIT